jgi:diguanylate cyclase (GGDEF)-like protein
MIDIDYFKKINDTYGHLTGDMILTQTAENITKNLRKTDIFGRYGGEEFMAILPKIKKEEAVVVAEKIRAMIEDFSFNEDIRITISIGVAEYQPECQRMKSLIKPIPACIPRKRTAGTGSRPDLGFSFNSSDFMNPVVLITPGTSF